MWRFIGLLYIVAICGIQFSVGQGWKCTLPTNRIFSSLGSDALLQFDVRNDLVAGSGTFQIKFYNGMSKGTILYVQGQVHPNPGQGVSITGDAVGNVNVTLHNIARTDAGTYLISFTDGLAECICLYILGVPTKPKITVKKSPEVGGSAILTCNSSSTTAPSNHSLSLAYNWKVDNVDNPADYTYSINNEILTVSNVSRNDASKNFTCSAKEDGRDRFTSINSNVYSLNVLYGPDNLHFTPSERSYEKVENITLSPVRCNASCNPTCSFKWNKVDTGAVISENAVLDLKTLTSSKAGTYRCTATRAGDSSRTKDLTVNIIYGPTNMYFVPATVSYRHDENINLPTIRCSSECWDCQYSWKGPNSYNSSRPILDLHNLQRSMAGNYSCTATNIKSSPQRQTSKELTIEVRYGPDAVDVSVHSPYSVREGDTAPNITCSADCFPGCTYNWRNLTDTRRKIISMSNVLSLKTVNRYMTGHYKCTSSNAATQYTKSSETTISVIVKYAPDVETSFSTTNFSEGVDDLTLFCNGSGVPASYNYVGLTQKWNDFVIPNSNTALNGTKQYSSILFSPLRFQDTGTYTCTLNNGIRNMQGILNQSGSRQIIVEVRPKILTRELRFTGATDGQAHIQVAVYSFPQLETLNITRSDGKVVVTDTKYNLTKYNDDVRTTFYGVSVSLNGTIIDLTIQNLQEYDFGNYTLMLTNRVGTSSKKLFVIAQSKPSAPKLFEYVSGYSVPTFIWQKNFNGGLDQSFVIQTSPDGSQMWTHHTNIHENDKRFKINGTFYMANITGLQPGLYNVGIFANNSEGDSDTVDLGYTFEIPKDEVDVDQNSLPVGAVIGLSASALVVIGIVIVILIVLKRRTGNKDGGETRLDTRKNQSDDTDDEDEVNTVNPMYISADDVQQTENSYAQPVKKKKIAETKDIYAMVDKKAKNGKKDTDIYENAEPPNEKKLKYKERKGKEYEENPYENPAAAATKKPKKIVNKDGLIYADLAFNDQPKGQKKLVIHGLDSMTEYVEVDFSKKAEPLPDSDEEDSRKTT